MLLCAGTLLLCFIVFFAVPYYLLKSSFSHDCNVHPAICSQSIEHTFPLKTSTTTNNWDSTSNSSPKTADEKSGSLTYWLLVIQHK